MVNKGGFYIVDDMLPQPNWPEGHQEKAINFVKYLESRNDLIVTKQHWATGIIISVKKCITDFLSAFFIRRTKSAATNSRFGNRLADGIAIGYKSISAIVPARRYKFSYYLLSSFLVTIFSFGSGLDIINFQPIAKPFPLAVSVKSTS